MPRMTPSTVLLTFVVLEAASVASCTLTLTAEQSTPLRWSVGGTIHLDYVLETSADTLVTCDVDGRHLSEYALVVPNKGEYQMERRSLFIERASSTDAGLYECRATAGNATSVLSWRLRQLADVPCPTSHVCTEGASVSCPPCTCPTGHTFYGRNREFRCRKTPWYVGLHFPKAPTIFHHLEQPVMDYELTTFGDTQVNLYMDDVLVHTHTVLVASNETVVRFQERIVLTIPVDANLVHSGVLEARLRGTSMLTNLTATIQRVRADQNMVCGPHNAHFCQAIGTACDSNVNKCVCISHTHVWTQKTCMTRCDPTLQCAPVAHSTCKSVGNEKACKCDSPRRHFDGQCVVPECLTDMQCEAKYGKHSLCTAYNCTCTAGSVLRDGKCSPVDCLSNEECKDAHTHCVVGKCVCHGDYDRHEEECRKGPVGKCPGNLPCAKDNTECVKGHCYCKDGYRALHLEPGSPCLKITCSTNEDCSWIRGVCFDGRCSCLDLLPPAALTCPRVSLLSADEVQTPLKLAVCTLAMIIGMILVLAISVMCMKSKEDYDSTVDDDEAAEGMGALMAAKKVLEAVQQAAKDDEPPPPEGGLKTMMRSFFPNMTQYLLGVHGDVGRISFGDSTASGSSIDV